jgi:pantoate kinase
MRKLVEQPTLEALYDEVRKVNERLGFIERVIEEIIISGLPTIKLSEKKLREIRSCVEKMRKGEYVDLEALKGTKF